MTWLIDSKRATVEHNPLRAGGKFFPKALENCSTGQSKRMEQGTVAKPAGLGCITPKSNSQRISSCSQGRLLLLGRPI